MGAPLVRDASDPRQVGWSDKMEKRRAKRAREAMIAVMSTPQGRAVMWDLLGRTGMYASPWSNSAMQVHFNIGRMNVGLELRALLLDAGEKNFEAMEREARTVVRRDNDEAAAAHPPVNSEDEDSSEETA